MNVRAQIILFFSLATLIAFAALNIPFVNTFDRYITSQTFNFFYQFQIGWLTNVMRLITDYSYLFIIAIFSFTVSEKKYKKAARFVAYTLMVYGIIALIQLWLGRVRPFITIDEIKHLTINPEVTFSMPSVHATMAFFVAAYFVEELKGYGIKVKAVEIGALLVASLIAFTRVYLGVHYVFDVTAGMFFGLGFGLLINILDDWLMSTIFARRKTERHSN